MIMETIIAYSNVTYTWECPVCEYENVQQGDPNGVECGCGDCGDTFYIITCGSKECDEHEEEFDEYE